jgi:glutamate racemase
MAFYREKGFRGSLAFMNDSSSKKRPVIGLFDSGRGGFSVWSELLSLHLPVDYVYMADRAYAPYGGRSDTEILERSKFLVKTLLEQGADLIVVACNTATAVAIDELRKSCPVPIVGIEPYLTAAQHFNWSLAPDRRQVVLVTPSMARSARFMDLRSRRDPEGLIHVHPCPNMARLIEDALDARHQAQHKQEIVAQALNDLDPLKGQGFAYALLGCTHYALVTSAIEDYLTLEARAPGAAVAQRVRELLGLSIGNVAPQLLYADTRELVFRSIEVQELCL